MAVREHADKAMSRAMEEARRWAVVVLLVLVLVLGRMVSDLGDKVDTVKDSTGRTEAAAREIVEFVHEIENQPPSSQAQKAVQSVIDVLCASSDPVRLKACDDLRNGG